MVREEFGDVPGVHAFHKRFGTTVTVLSDMALQVFTKAGGNIFHFVTVRKGELLLELATHSSIYRDTLSIQACLSPLAHASTCWSNFFRDSLLFLTHSLCSITPTPSSFHLLPLLLPVLLFFSQPRPNLTSPSLPLLDH